MSQLAGIAAAVLLFGLICFQLLLVAGLPLGRLAWGGGHTVLPARLRIASVVAVAVYLLAMLIILERAELIDLVRDMELPRVATWALAAFFGIGVLMNAVSRSRSERYMAIVAFALSGLSVRVALGP